MDGQGSGEGFDPMKELVIDAIVGVGVPRLLAHEFEQTGMVHEGLWKRRALEACTLDALQALYGSLKSYQTAHSAQKKEMASRIVVAFDAPGAVHGHDIPAGH